MSLFENDQFRWRDTYFILFHEKNRPTGKATLRSLETLGRAIRCTTFNLTRQGVSSH